MKGCLNGSSWVKFLSDLHENNKAIQIDFVRGVFLQKFQKSLGEKKFRSTACIVGGR